MTLRTSDSGNGASSAVPAGRRASLILTGCFLSLLVLGWLDYATGYEMSFFIFYSVPVGFAAWYAGRWPAIAVALAATVSWLLADYFGGAQYSRPFYFYWNTIIHFGAFIINAVTIAKIKSDLNRQHELAADLGRVRQVLITLANRWPRCPACNRDRIHQAQTSPNQSQRQLVDLMRSHPELEATFCPECRSHQSAGSAVVIEPTQPRDSRE